MNFRFAFAALGACCFLLTACPETNTGPDAGPDAGPDPVVGTCAEACDPQERCDEASRTCVPGCTECEPGSTACVQGCPQGRTCVNDGSAFSCVESSTSCGGNVCEAGQTTCLYDGSNCSCLTFRASGGDSCAAQNRFCEGLYNDVTMTGGNCRPAALYEECAATANCGSGLVCSGGLCLRPCGKPGGTDPVGSCGRDEECIPQTTGLDFCYWNGIFAGSSRDEGCVGIARDAQGEFRQREDGGYVENYVPISFRCVPRAATAGMPFTTPVVPENLVGTCVPVTLRFADNSANYVNCKSPGDVPRFGRCRIDDSAGTEATTCGEGLICLPQAGANAFVDNADEGICLDVCNAALPIAGVPAEPSCGAGAVCVNYTREIDRLGVIGACTKSCDVFGGAPNFGCAPEGNVTFACVPVEPTGSSLVSQNGSGICVPPFDPARPLAAAGQPCAVTDPFQGASCVSGLVCAPEAGGVSGTCRAPCDLECSGDSPPERCAQLSNATCAGTATCSPIDADPLQRTGVCL